MEKLISNAADPQGELDVLSGELLAKAFYTELEQNEDMQLNFKPHHLSLYIWVGVRQNETKCEIVDLPVRHTMMMSGIGSDHTLKKCLEDLEKWGIIEIVSRKGERTKVRLAVAYRQKHQRLA